LTPKSKNVQQKEKNLEQFKLLKSVERKLLKRVVVISCIILLAGIFKGANVAIITKRAKVKIKKDGIFTMFLKWNLLI
jgi:uncharacterized membrane protein YqhA